MLETDIFARERGGLGVVGTVSWQSERGRYLYVSALIAYQADAVSVVGHIGYRYLYGVAALIGR